MKRSVFLILVFILFAAGSSRAATNTYSPTLTATATPTFTSAPSLGSSTPTKTRSLTYTLTTTPTPSLTPVLGTWTPTGTWTGTQTRTATPTQSATRTRTPTGTSTVTFTPTRTTSATPTRTPTAGTGCGTYLFQFGSVGTGNGQFQYAQDVAVGPSGDIYVVDYSNHRVQKFSSTGTYLSQWGSYGGADGQFRNPSCLAIDPATGNVYVADINNYRIQKFDATGAFLTKWGTSGTGDSQFNSPFGLAVGPTGNVYVVDEYNYRVQYFSASGAFQGKWGSLGTGTGQFSRPKGVAVDSSGNVYVTDAVTDRVQKFDATGTFITQWGGTGSGDGQFNDPADVSADSSGNVYVTEMNNHRIQQFSPSGSFIAKWGSFGSANGEFYYPSGVLWDGGKVYVGDEFNNRVQVFGCSLSSTMTPTRTKTPSHTPTPVPLTNGGFETGDLTAWNDMYGHCGLASVVQSSTPIPVISGFSHSGGSAVLLGNSGTAEVAGDSFVYQTFAVPSGPCPALNFWYYADSQESDLSARYDFQQVRLLAAPDGCSTNLGTILYTTSNDRTWTYVTYDLSALVGLNVTVEFKVRQDGYGDATSMFVDDVSVTTSCFTATATPTITLTPTASLTPTITLTRTMTRTPTASYTPCAICTAAAGSWTPTLTRTISATATATPSATRTSTPGGITGGTICDFETGTGQSVYGGENNVSLDGSGSTLLIDMMPGCSYGSAGGCLHGQGTLVQDSGGSYGHCGINILPGGPAVDIRGQSAGHSIQISFNNGTPGATYQLCLTSANVTDGDYYCLTFTATASGWQDYTFFFPDVNTTEPVFSQSGSGAPRSWDSCAGQVQSVQIGPVASSSGPVSYDFKVDDIRFSDGSSDHNNLQSVADAFGCDLGTVRDAYDLNLDEYLTWIVIRISVKCGCSPHDVLSLRSTMSWGEICEAYGLTWDSVIADVDARRGGSGLTPTDADPGECLQSISNGSGVIPEPANPPYVPAGSLTPSAPSLVCP